MPKYVSLATSSPGAHTPNTPQASWGPWSWGSTCSSPPARPRSRRRAAGREQGRAGEQHDRRRGLGEDQQVAGARAPDRRTARPAEERNLEKELGWDEMSLTKEGKASPLGATASTASHDSGRSPIRPK